MNTTLTQAATPRSMVSSLLTQLCRKQLLKKLSSLRYGTIEFMEQDVTHAFKGLVSPDSYHARVTIKTQDFYPRAALGGTIGAGESFRDGDWECDNLVELVRIFVANREIMQNFDSGLASLMAPLQKLFHLTHKNSIQGSKENIRAHYDLGNDFFELFLDSTWMYSSGIYANEQSTLQEASIEKIDRICRKLDLKPTDRLIEIGTGWGGFAIHAAEKYGCHVTTTTISQAQYDLARKRVAEKGLEDRITLLLEDYRKLEGKYDKLVSIEMIEAVGLNFLDQYFEKCGNLLKPSGSMMLQAIIIQDQYFEQAKKSVDFIQRHIFPGSGIPSILSIVDAVARKTDMRLSDQKDLAEDYAKTLNAWAKNFQQNQAKIIALGYPETLHRLWQYYFAYCEGGFRERQIGCVQMMFTKPGWRKSWK